MAIRIGISGWRYAPWRSVFYPPGLAQRRELAYAASRFPSIEINGSFYSLQSPSSWERWYREVPDDFVFAVKGPRFITHTLRLRDTRAALANFLASGVLGLRHKLGPLLWQLPPTLKYVPAQLDAFLSQLPRNTAQALTLARRRERSLMKGRTALPEGEDRPLRHALEVRHASFCTPEFVEQLREQRIGLVVADSAGRHPILEDATADFVYLRLHGDQELYVSGYSDVALGEWARKIDAWSKGTHPRGARMVSPAVTESAPRDIYCYFDNDAKVHAPFDAEALAQRLLQRR